LRQAARLKDYITKIRKDYEGNLYSLDKKTRQLATAMWIIDKLALRVGGEKGEDEADTVGCCSLRREHLKYAIIICLSAAAAAAASIVIIIIIIIDNIEHVAGSVIPL
jgi:DNA topoisomerase IB